MTKYSNIHTYSCKFVLSFSKEFEVDIIAAKNLFKKNLASLLLKFSYLWVLLSDTSRKILNHNNT